MPKPKKSHRKAKPKHTKSKLKRHTPRHSERKIELYPIRFKEIYKKKIWGGNSLRKVLGKRGTLPKTGESWEITLHEKDVSIVANGYYKGWPLAKLISHIPQEIMGNEHYMRFYNNFPLIVKFIDAKERLSLQVHPSDEHAQRYETEGSGKTETWYVVYAPENAKVIRGVLPGTTIGEFMKHLQDNTIDECLNVMSVQEGDVIFIPPGTIHTAYGGVVLLEVQQNSDITYRLHDWGRTDFNGRQRQLDTEKALNVMDFFSMGVSKYKPIRLGGYSYKRKLLLRCEKFVMELMEFRKRIKEKASNDRFHILTIIDGTGVFYYGKDKKRKTTFKRGETYLIPAYIGEYDIATRGNCTIVCSYVM